MRAGPHTLRRRFVTGKVPDSRSLPETMARWPPGLMACSFSLTLGEHLLS
jgi:hypothetical protein